MFVDKYLNSSKRVGFHDHSHNGEVTLLLGAMINSADHIQIAVDVGAHGKAGSNTHDLLRHFGWRGVLIEANPRLIPRIEKEFAGCNFDVANVAVSSQPGKAKLYLGIHDEISSIHREWTEAWGPVRDFVEIDVGTLPSVLNRDRLPIEESAFQGRCIFLHDRLRTPSAICLCFSLICFFQEKDYGLPCFKR